MKTWASYCGGLLVAGGLTATAPGQVPAVPAGTPGAAGAATPAATSAAGAAGQAAGAAPHRLKSFFSGCKEKFCASPFGNLVTNTMQPISALTGGILGNCCPPGPNPADLAKPPTSARGAAARIQQDEAEAKARRAAVRYLGTVDCNYWPEAEAGLITALRTDRNECVRYEAALSLGRGCCCTKAVIAALSLTVSSSTSDGNPAENSERVRAAAQFALDHCLARLCIAFEPAVEEIAPKPEPIKEGAPKEGESKDKKDKDDKKKSALSEADARRAELLPPYYKQLQSRPMSELIEQARKAINQNQVAPVIHSAQRDRRHSVTEIIAQAVSESPAADRTPGYVAQPMPQGAVTAAPPVAAPVTAVKNVPASRVVVEQSVNLRPTNPVGTSAQPAKPTPATADRKPILPEPVRPAQTTSAVQPMPRVVEAPRPTPPAVETPRQPTRMAETPRQPMRPLETPRPAASRPAEMPHSTARPAVNRPAEIPTPSTTVRPAHFLPAGTPEKSAAPATKPVAPMPTSSILPPRPTASMLPSSEVQVAKATVKPPMALPLTAPQAPPVESAADARVRQALHALQTSKYPEHREWAAGQLSSSEMRMNTMVLPALIQTAREDKEPAVRAACVRALGKMNANTPAVVAALQMLKQDSDARVRSEAGMVLAKFGLAPSHFAEQGSSLR